MVKDILLEETMFFTITCKMDLMIKAGDVLIDHFKACYHGWWKMGTLAKKRFLIIRGFNKF